MLVAAENNEKNPWEVPRPYFMGMHGLKFISPLRGTNSKPTYYLLVDKSVVFFGTDLYIMVRRLG